jgi:hypothetical protein
MALASLLVSILALAIAVAAAISSHRQASAAEGSLSIERDRRMEERRPRFTGNINRMRDGGAELAVTLESSEAFEWVEFSIPPGQGFSFSEYQLGIFQHKHNEPTLRAFSYIDYGPKNAGDRKGMSPGETMTWKVQLGEHHMSTVRIEATCYGLTGERWNSVLIVVPVGPDISKAVR